MSLNLQFFKFQVTILIFCIVSFLSLTLYLVLACCPCCKARQRVYGHVDNERYRISTVSLDETESQQSEEGCHRGTCGTCRWMNKSRKKKCKTKKTKMEGKRLGQLQATCINYTKEEPAKFVMRRSSYTEQRRASVYSVVPSKNLKRNSLNPMIL